MIVLSDVLLKQLVYTHQVYYNRQTKEQQPQVQMDRVGEYPVN